jgi:Bacterial Ig domain/FG-GAP-like repeat
MIGTPGRVKGRVASIPYRLPALCLALFCAAAGAATPTYTLIVGPRVNLGGLQNGLPNGAYTSVSATIGDLTGDGSQDIVLGINGAPPAVYLNNGTSNPFGNVEGVFVATPPGPSSPGLGWGAATLVDVDADGHPDLAIPGFNSPNLVYLNNGTSNPFNAATGIAVGTSDEAFAASLGDVNGDGYPDMVVANSNHVPSRLYMTNGAPLTSGGYSTAQIGTDLGYGRASAIADVNGDGKPDIILAYTEPNAPGTDPTGIAIYLNNGTSSPFNGVTPLRLLTGDSIQAITVADLTHDGLMDLVVSESVNNLATPALYVFLNTGNPSQPYTTAEMLKVDSDVGGGCSGIAVGDVNGDGRPDLLFSCQAPLANASPAPPHPAVGAIYLNNGTASPFANVAPVDIPSPQAGDFAWGVAVGTLVSGGPADVLLADGDIGLGGYYPTTLDQNPVAQNDSAVCAIDKSVQISVLANDTAGPGQSLNAGSVTITTAPSHGAATINTTTGVVTYQPATGYSGADQLAYTVSDGLGANSNAATVSITVQPAPVAVNDTDTIQAGQAATINVLSNDTTDGGTLNSATIRIVVAPTHGTAVVSNGEVVYTPTSGYSGLDTFQYTVQDNLGTTSNAATVSVDVQAPASSGGHGGGGAVGLLDLLGLAGLGLIRFCSSKAAARI